MPDPDIVLLPSNFDEIYVWFLKLFLILFKKGYCTVRAMTLLCNSCSSIKLKLNKISKFVLQTQGRPHYCGDAYIISYFNLNWLKSTMGLNHENVFYKSLVWSTFVNKLLTWPLSFRVIVSLGLPLNVPSVRGRGVLLREVMEASVWRHHHMPTRSTK